LSGHTHPHTHAHRQLSILPSVGLEMSTGQSAVMRCGWGVKAGWLIPFEGKRVWRVKLCGLSLTRATVSAFEVRSRKCAIQMSSRAPLDNMGPFVGLTILVRSQRLRQAQTQPLALSGMENVYRPMGSHRLSLDWKFTVGMASLDVRHKDTVRAYLYAVYGLRGLRNGGARASSLYNSSTFNPL